MFIGGEIVVVVVMSSDGSVDCYGGIEDDGCWLILGVEGTD